MEDLLKRIEKPSLPMFVSNWMFGIGIIEYPLGKQRRVISFIYSVTILTIYCSICIYAYPYLLSMANEMETNGTIMKIIFYSHIMITISIIALGWHRSKGIRCIVEHMAIADYLLEKIGVPINYKKILRMQIEKILGFFAFICIILTINSLTIFLGYHVESGQIVAIFVINFPVIIMFIVDSTFINILAYGLNNMKKLNGALKSLLTSTDDCPQHRRLIKKYLHAANIVDDLSINCTEDKTYTLQCAKKVHLELVKGCQQADDTFGLHILLSLSMAVAIITGSLYHTYVLIVHTKVSRDNFYKVFADTCTWVIYYFSKIYSLSCHCSSISQEAIKTGDIICEFYDEPFVNKQTQKEVHDFQMQLVQNPLKFGAYGFITLDFTLISVVIGSVTTYLMILIQLGNFVLPEN